MASTSQDGPPNIEECQVVSANLRKEPAHGEEISSQIVTDSETSLTKHADGAAAESRDVQEQLPVDTRVATGDEVDTIIRPLSAEEQKEMELKERYDRSSIVQKYILEIAFMLYIFALMLPTTPMADVFMRKACRYNLHYNESICNHLNDNDTVKAEVQVVSNYYGTLKDIVSTFPGAAVSLIAGQYMARYGMKFPIMAALLGAKITMLMTMLTFYYKTTPLLYTVLAQLPSAFTGGIIVLLTAIYTNITIYCPMDQRRQRFLMIQFFIFLPMLAAMSVGSYLYKKIGIVFLTAGGSLVLMPATVLMTFFFKDVEKSDEAKCDGWGAMLRHSAGLGTLKQSFSFLVRPRPDYARAQLYSMFVCILIGVTAFTSSQVYFLYVNLALKWDVEKYGMIDSITLTVVFILSFPNMILFSKVLKLSDPAMVFIGFVFLSLKYILYSLIKFGEVFYYAQALAGLPFYVGMTGIRAHISRLLAPKEVPVIFALTSAAERLVPIATDALIMITYNETVSSFAGFVFAAQGVVFLIPALLALLCIIWTRRYGLPKYLSLEEETDDAQNVDSVTEAKP